MRKEIQPVLIIFSILALLNVMFVPIFDVWGGLIPSDVDTTFFEVIEAVFEDEDCWRHWVVIFTMSIFIPSLFMFIAALCGSRGFFITSNVIGIIIWFKQIIDYGMEDDGFSDMFDFDVLEKLSGLDGKQMKKDIIECVDVRKFMLPMIYINYRKLGISMQMYLVRMFQNVPSYRKAEIVNEFAGMDEFVDIFQFGDSFYDCLLTVYAEINDVDAIRSKLENYAEIEEVWTAVSKRQFRRWVARLDDENGYWEECVMTDDFLQNRLEAGAPKCRFCTDPEEVK